jgi:maltose alpha-D-glucosyltransferase/alpha-amylase
LAFSTGATGEKITAERPLSVISTMATPTGTGVLHDASGREDFRQVLLSMIERGASLELSNLRSAAVEVAASLAASASGHSARQAAENGEAEELLAHPERATHNQSAPGMVHLRPHEVFPSDSGVPAVAPPAPSAHAENSENVVPHPLAGMSVEPLPLTAQPGEAAAPPRSENPAPLPGSNTPRLQPRESPSAGERQTRTGVLHAAPSRAFAFERGEQHLRARVGSAEQSNTSILYNDKLILKIFRRLQSGENPDVEIGRFLTEKTHFRNIPPFLGEITITPSAGEKTTVAMLQSLVANQGDGWEWFLHQLSEFFAAVISVPAPPQAAHTGWTSLPETPVELREHARSTVEAASLLGRRTAEMHLALAIANDNPSFSSEPFSAEDLRRDALRIEDQLRSTFDALRNKLASLPDDVADDAAHLLARRRDLLARAHSIAAGEAAGKKIRIHGDYHLGQTLRTGSDSSPSGGDFILLDFEGEPARPLYERRRKQSPLKDVAGMVRSFSYAASSGLDQFRAAHPDREAAAENLASWAHAWESAAVSEFLRAYQAEMGTRPDLLPEPGRAHALYSAYVLEKALYELLYELNNRPAWLRIPLSGVLFLD